MACRGNRAALKVMACRRGNAIWKGVGVKENEI